MEQDKTHLHPIVNETIYGLSLMEVIREKHTEDAVAKVLDELMQEDRDFLDEVTGAVPRLESAGEDRR